MTTILLLTMIVSGLMMMCGATKWAIFVVIVSVVGCFSYRILLAGEDLQSVAGDAFLCLMSLSFGLYAAKQLIKFDEATNS